MRSSRLSQREVVRLDGFDVTPVELQVCGSMLSDISREVHDTMQVLRAEVDALLSGGWQGSAAQGFAQGWDQWQTGAKDVLEGLAAMGRLLGTTGRDYGALDEGSAARLWQSGEGL